jgi:hypothetical protein
MIVQNCIEPGLFIMDPHPRDLFQCHVGEKYQKVEKGEMQKKMKKKKS